MPSPFSCCPVNREYAWKKTQIEKKISSFLSSSSFSVVPHDMPLPSSNGSSGFTQIKVSDNYLLIYSSFFLIFFKKSYCFFASEQIWAIENLKECFLTWKASLKQSLKGRWRIYSSILYQLDMGHCCFKFSDYSFSKFSLFFKFFGCLRDVVHKRCS